MKAIKGVERFKEIKEVQEVKAVDGVKGVRTVLWFIHGISISGSYENLHYHAQHAHSNKNGLHRREEKRIQTKRENEVMVCDDTEHNIE